MTCMGGHIKLYIYIYICTYIYIYNPGPGSTGFKGVWFRGLGLRFRVQGSEVSRLIGVRGWGLGVGKFLIPQRMLLSECC